ncbi:Rpn family recombination-promoting nuclease/putative transposase [Paenibacillus cymbidii]|uniref:Rpn family recombination-promoting nuclease/putative transposase n=1 Tax=Paenibacillus cymbidii TaxID=1639034 RepID=UPI00108210A4|nr:Rpn family recombination-promoting nuclease/putative transposase [Paenibacillus cymbidii]
MSARGSLKPKNDFVFGKLFGEPDSRDSLKALLNAILRQDGREPIAEIVVIENRTLDRWRPEDKLGSLDILAELASGEQVNVEMQVANPYNMIPRTIFYAAKLFTRSIKAGQDYEVLRKTIAINLLNFRLLASSDRFHHTFHLRDDVTPHALLTDVMELHFIEFPKFEQTPKDKRNPLHRWLMFMDDQLGEDELKELMAMDSMIEKTEARLEQLSDDPLARELAEARERAIRDWNSSMAGSRKEGREEGKTEIAVKLLKSGMNHDFVAEMTGLTLEQIGRLDAER